MKTLDKINYYCYVLYLICMPLQIPAWLNSDLFPKLLGLSFFFLIPGLIINAIIIIKSNDYKILQDKVLRTIIFLYLYIIISQSIMTLILKKTSSELYNIGIYDVYYKKLIIYTYLIAILFYNVIMLKKVDVKKLIKVLWYVSLIGSIVIILQILLLKINWFVYVYDAINFVQILPSSQFLLHMNRICGFCMEPSFYALFHVIVTIPIIYLYITKKEDKITIAISLFIFIVVIIGAYYTQSSTVYVALGAMLLIMLICFIANLKKYKFPIICSFLVAIIIMLLFKPVQQSVYMLLYKVIDLTNWSTSFRYSIVYNDIKCFLKYPILGVGDGNQGFLYPLNIINTIFDKVGAIEVVAALNGDLGIMDGGPMIPSIISGFGLVGSVIFTILMYKTIRLMCRTEYKYYYISCIITLLICSCVAYSIFYNYIFALIFLLPWCINTFNPKYEKFICKKRVV